MHSNIDKYLRAARSRTIIGSALKILREQLPRTLKYHTAGHTDDVLHDVVLFALHDGLDAHALDLLVIAAAYHDVGFIESSKENEPIGARYAVDAMQAEGSFIPADIELVRSMIIDTTLRFTPDGPRQIPTSELAGYLLDADVSNLGRDDFFEKAELVRLEVGIADKDQFLIGLVTFMQAHTWYSNAAKTLREAKKAENVARLAELVGRL